MMPTASDGSGPGGLDVVTAHDELGNAAFLDALGTQLKVMTSPAAARDLVARELLQRLRASQVALSEQCDGEGLWRITSLVTDGRLKPMPPEVQLDRFAPLAAIIANTFSPSITVPWIINGRIAAIGIVRCVTVREWPLEAVALIRQAVERLWFALERIDADARTRALEKRQAQLLRLVDGLAAADSDTAIAQVALDTLAPNINALQVGLMRMEGRVSMLASTVNDADALGGSGLPILQVIAAGPAGIGGETTLLIDRAEGDREGEQPASVTLFPLRRNGLSYGTLLVAHRPERPPDRDERLLIREVCARTAAALAGLVTRAPAGAKRQDLALHGLRHGQRNLLALVRTIARQLLPLANSSQDFAERFDARLASLARTEALMLDAGRGPIWFRDVVAMELGAAGACGPHVHADGPDVVLSRACVQATALAVYELASNAVGHGALSARGGSLALHWQVRSMASSTYLTIRWIETCPGHVILPGAAGVPGFGRQLLEQALPYQFGARVAFNIEPSGLCCVIDLPLCQ